MTPLHMAAWSDCEGLEKMRLLVEEANKCNVNLQDEVRLRLRKISVLCVSVAAHQFVGS